jgi:L-amino acid N-acyltransferase YncA
MTMTIRIRSAEIADLPAILGIYNENVLTSTATYDYEPHTLEQRRRWFDHHQEQGLPILVAVNSDGKVVGWGSLSHFRERIGYRFTVEHSVYIASDSRRQGIGRLMLSTLIDAACALGKHIIIGGVDGENEASIQLHVAFGFDRVAHFKQVGYKFDRWLDVIFFQRTLTQ